MQKTFILLVVLFALFAAAFGRPNEDSWMGKEKGKGKGKDKDKEGSGGKPEKDKGKGAQGEASTSGGKKSGKSQECKNTTTGCKSCVKQGLCEFDPNKKQCMPKGSGLPDLVTNVAKCQQIDLNPSEGAQKTTDELWGKMKKHVLQGDVGGDPTSGRHTFSAWRDKNKDAGRCDIETHICVFRLQDNIQKNVWDNRAGGYTDGDIETMCKTAITLNFQALGRITGDGAFIVQNKFKKPVCVRHQVAGSGSCFPVGIHQRRNALGTRCSEDDELDTKAIEGKTEEIPAT